MITLQSRPILKYKIFYLNSTSASSHYNALKGSSDIRYFFAFTALESERKKRILATAKWRENIDPDES